MISVLDGPTHLVIAMEQSFCSGEHDATNGHWHHIVGCWCGAQIQVIEQGRSLIVKHRETRC